MNRIFGLAVALIASAVLGLSVVGHSETSASSPAGRLPVGSSRAEAMDITCDWTSVAGASHVWYRISPRDEKQMDLRLVAYPASLERIEFLIYVVGSEESEDATRVGRGRTGDIRVVQEWSGTAVDGATYYVNVINSSHLPVDYGLCDSYQHMPPF